jgi:DNA-binding XRE family transcriptional regulator
MKDQVRAPARLKLATSDGVVMESFARSHARRRSSAVHRKKVLRAQALSLPANGLNDRSPCVRRNAPSLLPLADRPMSLGNVDSHFGKRVPEPEHLVNGFHGDVIAWDNLSRQGSTTRPVTASPAGGTIRPMGKASTPTAFKKEFCQRLKAARIMAGIGQAEFAKELGLLLNTYNKYETRSLLPHYLIPRACEILGVDPAVLFLGVKEAKRKTG